MMTTADNCVKDPFAYLWIIENISELTYIDLVSVPFVELSISEKELCLYISENEEFCVYLLSQDGFLLEETCGTIIEVSILAADGSVLISNTNNGSELFVILLPRNDFLERKNEFILNNTMTVQCKIRKIKDKILTGFCYVRTEVETHRKYIVWPVEEFSALRSSTTENLNELTMDKKRVYPLERFAIGHSDDKTFIILYLKENSLSEDVYVDFVFEEGRNYTYVYEITALDANGKIFVSKTERGRLSELYNFPPLISKSELTSNKSLFLPNDTLILTCTFEIFFAGIPSKDNYCTTNITLNVPDLLHTLNLPVFFDITVATNRNPMRNIVFQQGSEEDEEEEEGDCCGYSCSLQSALGHLHSDLSLSDLSLKIGDKVYPVHKSILSSRSPVFEKILSANAMKKTIEIEDMDENTLGHLLQYIYTETVGNLDFATAMSLYKTAHDHEFLDLRYECSCVLRGNLRGSNAHEIMALAKKCQDDSLENIAEQYEYAISLDSDENMDLFENDMDIW